MPQAPGASHPSPALLQTAPIEPEDLSTSDRVLHLGALWNTSRWKRKVRNKKLLTRMIAKVEVSDDSDDSGSSDSGGDGPDGYVDAGVAHERQW